jgi:hypothetical protein
MKAMVLLLLLLHQEMFRIQTLLVVMFILQLIVVLLNMQSLTQQLIITHLQASGVIEDIPLGPLMMLI